MAQPMDVVLAGTKPFALALFAPLTERTGTRPRIAPDPAQALTLCGASSGLLVVEYGAPWLPALTQLRKQAAGLRIVAALPQGQESAALVLGPLGIEVVPWDGKPAPVVAAAGQALGLGAAAAPAAAAPVAAAPATAAAAPRPAPAPPAPAAPRPAPVAAPAPAAAAPVAAAPRPAPAPVAPRPAPTAPPPPPPVIAAPAPAPPPPAAAEAAPLDLFSDLGGTEATPVPGATPAVDPFSVPAGTASVYVPPPRERPVVWPETVPPPAEAARALRAALSGREDAASPLGPAAGLAVAAMSELERGLLVDAGSPAAAAIQAAAALRLRVAHAIATRPALDAPVDQAAVAALLAEVDVALAAVNALLPDATGELQPIISAARNALVKDAVDFSEACHSGTAPKAPPPRSAVARLISVGVAATEKPRTRRGIVVVLLAAVLAAAAFHGYRWSEKTRAVAALPTLPGAPDRMMLLPGRPGSPRVLLPIKGPPDRAQVERFKAEQEQLGNVVTELEGGGLSVAPRAVREREERKP